MTSSSPVLPSVTHSHDASLHGVAVGQGDILVIVGVKEHTSVFITIVVVTGRRSSV